jgi:hypothetical protein
MLIEHLSVSRGQCYELCQQQYKFKYHLKVIPDQPEQIYFVYGKLVHRAAELYIQFKGEQDIIDIGKKLLSGDLEFQDFNKLNILTTEYKNKYWNHLNAIKLFSNEIAKKFGYDGELEYKMHFDLDAPNQKMILGFIDRLIIKDDFALIIDYKTSKDNAWRKNKKTIKTDIQLSTYAYHVYDKFKINPKNIHAVLFYMEGKKAVSTNFEEEYLLKTKESLKNLYCKIENQEESTVSGNIGFHCRRCDFNNKCHFYRTENVC